MSDKEGFGISQEIGETLRGAILGAIVQLNREAEGIQYDKLKQFTMEELERVIDVVSEVGAILEMSDSYIECLRIDYDE